MLDPHTDLVAGLDPVVFVKALGFTDPDPWQVDALRWTGKRAIWNIARQSGKSTVAALVGLHTAIYKPKSLILLISPSLRQSSELFRKVSDWLARMPTKVELLEDNRLSCSFFNGSRIVSLPSSEQTIRGFSGVDLIIEDEASRVPDELYYATRPMLAVSGGRMILMSTPFGRRGHFFEEWANGGNDWERVEIPALQNPRIPSEFLEEERRSLGEWWYRQEYECQFLNAINQVFSYDTVMSALSSDVKPIFLPEQQDHETQSHINPIDPTVKSLFGG
jgi:hypothetical protein